MSMNSPILKAVEEIEATLTAYVDKTETKCRELADEILQLKQCGTLLPDEGSHHPRASLGSLVAKPLEANADLLAKTRSIRFEVKAAGDAVTTSQGRKIESAGVGAPSLLLPFGIQSGLVTRPPGGVSAVEYFRYTGTEGAAGMQAGEGAAKSAVRPTHTSVTQAALTIAGYTNMSRQAMADSAELQQAVDVTLKRALDTALDSTLNGGSVTPAWAGLLSLATNHTSTVYSSLWDAVSEVATTMMTAGFAPDVIGISPADWLAVVTAKNPTTDDYYRGATLPPCLKPCGA